MAGQPKTRKVKEKVAGLGLDTIFDQISAGQTLVRIAKSLDINPLILGKLLNSTPENKARLKEARQLGAHALVEETLDIVDSANPRTVKVADLQTRARQWIASHWNTEYADINRNMPSITINLNQLHLDAIRRHCVSDNNVIDAPRETITQATLSADTTLDPPLPRTTSIPL